MLPWTGRAKGTVSGKFTRQLAQLMEVLQAVRIAKLATNKQQRELAMLQNMATDVGGLWPRRLQSPPDTSGTAPPLPLSTRLRGRTRAQPRTERTQQAARIPPCFFIFMGRTAKFSRQSLL
jgi:hypothetical protein